MQIKKTNLSHDVLIDSLEYDSNTGYFYWKRINSNRCKQGMLAGTETSIGYWQIYLCGKPFYAHRLAWFYIHKSWPNKDIDHIDGNRKNNSIVNLREANRSENMENQKTAQRRNKTGYLGVSFCKKRNKYVANITKNKKQLYIGEYKSPEDAHQAYLLKKRELHNYSTI